MTIQQCLDENPSVLKDTLTMMKAGQKAIYGLTIETGKEVNGTGIYWFENTETVPDTYIQLIRGQARSLYMSYEITDVPADPEEVSAMEELIKRIEDIDSRFPDVTVEELNSLDLTNGCLNQ